MFKLRLINKIEPFKLKCNFKFPDIVLAKFQIKEVEPKIEDEVITADHGYDALSEVRVKAVTSAIDSNIKSTNIKDGVNILGIVGSVQELNGEAKEITPTKEDQIIIPTAPKNALTSVKVKAIPDEYIVPTGKLTINENGNYDATMYANVEVDVPTGASEYFTDTITKGTNNVPGYTKSVKALPNNLVVDGNSCEYMFAYYNSNILPTLDTSNVITMERMFWKAPGLTNINFPYNLSNVTNLVHVFNSCSNMEVIIFPYKANKVTSINSIFSNCSKLTTVDFSFLSEAPLTNVGLIFYGCNKLTDVDLSILNADLVTNVQSMFSSCYALVNLKGLVNMGKGFDTSKSANYYEYNFNVSPCTKLTEASLIHILNNVYDIATKGCAAQTITLGSTNKAKLTSPEGQAALAQATSYGWTVS